MQKTDNTVDHNIAAYYDRNTKKFLRWGKHVDTSSIHQPIYKESSIIQDALHYPNQVIKDCIIKNFTDQQTLRIIDLGCGVGGSLAYLTKYLPAEKVDLTGITISKEQAIHARKKLSAHQNVEIICGNYLDYSHDHPFDMVYQIESFNHARSLDEMINAINQILVPGGIWIIFDDFIFNSTSNIAEKTINQYRNGWILPNLCELDAFIEKVEQSGFSIMQNDELSKYLVLNRSRDKWAKAFAPVIRILQKKSYYLKSIYGGLGRQRALQNGWLTYRGMVLKKQ